MEIKEGEEMGEEVGEERMDVQGEGAKGDSVEMEKRIRTEEEMG